MSLTTVLLMANLIVTIAIGVGLVSKIGVVIKRTNDLEFILKRIYNICVTTLIHEQDAAEDRERK